MTELDGLKKTYIYSPHLSVLRVQYTRVGWVMDLYSSTKHLLPVPRLKFALRIAIQSVLSLISVHLEILL